MWYFVMARLAAHAPAGVHGATPPLPDVPFLKRLPVAERAGLVSLSMQDHYVEANTRAAQHMLRMRFAEALSELEDYPGLRIHRSHWVADAAVERLVRSGGRTLALLPDGRRLPISETYRQAAVERFGPEMKA